MLYNVVCYMYIVNRKSDHCQHYQSLLVLYSVNNELTMMPLHHSDTYRSSWYDSALFDSEKQHCSSGEVSNQECAHSLVHTLLVKRLTIIIDCKCASL